MQLNPIPLEDVARVTIEEQMLAFFQREPGAVQPVTLTVESGEEHES